MHNFSQCDASVFTVMSKQDIGPRTYLLHEVTSQLTSAKKEITSCFGDANLVTTYTHLDVRGCTSVLGLNLTHFLVVQFSSKWCWWKLFFLVLDKIRTSKLICIFTGNSLTWGFLSTGTWWSQQRGGRYPQTCLASSLCWPGRCSGMSPACLHPGRETRPSAWRMSRPRCSC